MSFQAVNATRALKGLKPTDKFVLMMMASYAGMDDTLFPSQKTLARETGLSERSVWGALLRLEAAGLIRRDRRYSHGSRSSDKITLLFVPADSASKDFILAIDDVHTRNPRRLKPAPVAAEKKEEKILKGAREASAGQAPASRAPRPKLTPMPAPPRPTESPAEMAARLRATLTEKPRNAG